MCSLSQTHTIWEHWAPFSRVMPVLPKHVRDDDNELYASDDTRTLITHDDTRLTEDLPLLAAAFSSTDSLDVLFAAIKQVEAMPARRPITRTPNMASIVHMPNGKRRKSKSMMMVHVLIP